MKPEAILAKVALELKYNIDYTTRDLISTLYKTTTGKIPKPNKNLLNWFLDNYEFDGTDTWYHKDRSLPN